MTASNPMDTYKQFLSANRLADILLMKHATEAAQGQITIYGDMQVEEEFAKVCESLGYQFPNKVTRFTPTPIRPDEAA